MLKQVYEVDGNGYIKEIHIEDPEQTKFIKTDPPHGLYRAKWTGAKWVEDMAQEEIDELNNQPRLPTQEERIDMLENIILVMMEG